MNISLEISRVLPIILTAISINRLDVFSQGSTLIMCGGVKYDTMQEQDILHGAKLG